MKPPTKRRITSRRSLTDAEHLLLAEKLALATSFIVAARMVLADTTHLLTQEWKMHLNRLWKQTDLCEKLLERIDEADDDLLHEAAAIAVTGALEALERHKAMHERGEDMPPELFMLPLNESDRILVAILLKDALATGPTKVPELDERINHILQLLSPTPTQ